MVNVVINEGSKDLNLVCLWMVLPAGVVSRRGKGGGAHVKRMG